jgi:hypothetical protein
MRCVGSVGSVWPLRARSDRVGEEDDVSVGEQLRARRTFVRRSVTQRAPVSRATRRHTQSTATL